MGLFTPAWKNKDPQKRKEAVLKMTDQEKLKKVAAQDPEGYVRGYALERITDEKFLAAYAVQINDEWLLSKALEQIREQIRVVEESFTDVPLEYVGALGNSVAQLMLSEDTSMWMRLYRGK